ncbi:MAG TPA: YciI family protein [bacterium]|nr:YciI family protein [bacterium]
MRYLCLIYTEETKLGAMSKSEWDTLESEVLAYEGELRKRGYFVLAEALQSARAATIVRVRSGTLSTTDGPFAETKEQLGGFYLINAKDLNEAIQVAAKNPGARLGSIEVRPIREPEHQ